MVTANGSRWGIWKPPAEGGRAILQLLVENGDLPQRRPRHCQGPQTWGGGTASAPRSLQAGFVGEGNTQMLAM